MLSPTPPPPPPTPPIPPLPPLPQPLFPSEEQSAASVDRRYSYNPSILIIAAIIAAAIIAAASIHLLLRVLSRSRSPPFVHHLASSSSPSVTPSASALSSPLPQDPKSVIDSLPLFSLSSSTAKPSSSLDCAVCLSPFQPADELRLLPSCRHAFHSTCIDTWLKSNLSCPLCRSPIFPLPSPPPPPPPPPEAPARSDSFRVEIGTVSRRSDDSSAAAAAAPPHSRSYSLGSSFEYVVDEEIEAVLSRVRRRPAVEKSDLEQPPPPPGAEVAEVAGASHRSWLKEYVDRLASSASSSFSSLRFSQRGSQRFDSAAGVAAGGEGGDLERNLHLHLDGEDGGFSAFYKWLGV